MMSIISPTSCHYVTYAAEVIVRICCSPNIHNHSESARYAVKLSKQMLSSARSYEPLNNISKVNSWIKNDEDLNPVDLEFAVDRKTTVPKDERTKLEKEFKDQRLASRNEWKLGTELEKKETTWAPEKYLNSLLACPVVSFGGSTSDRTTSYPHSPVYGATS